MTTSRSRDLLNSMNERIKPLVDSWCDRRCYVALKHILKGWPLPSNLNDSIGEYLNALKNVRAFAKAEIGAEDAATVDDLIREAEKALRR